MSGYLDRIFGISFLSHYCFAALAALAALTTPRGWLCCLAPPLPRALKTLEDLVALTVLKGWLGSYLPLP